MALSLVLNAAVCAGDTGSGGGNTNSAASVSSPETGPFFHGKLELNNRNIPDTPELRLNALLEADDLWDLGHSMGVQYRFSPTDFKDDDRWDFYDRPMVANYSAFYRIPLVNGGPATNQDAHPIDFGYDEASRKFRLPAPSGKPEFNVYASRSTADTGVRNLSSTVILDIPNVRQIIQNNVEQTLTVNEDLGGRLSLPLPDLGILHSIFSLGPDYRNYESTIYKTNAFIFSEIHVDASGSPLPPVVSTVYSPVPPLIQSLHYLPLTLRWDGHWQDHGGQTYFGIGYSPNLWFSGNRSDVQNAAGSQQATGFWHILNANLSREQILRNDWRLCVAADGQWASEPLIVNEQYGIGGMDGVRGYREGEVLGDTGWRVTSEVRSHALTLGCGKVPLRMRAMAFLDYGEAYLLDPQGRRSAIELCGTGGGLLASINQWCEGQLLVGVPLLNVPGFESGDARIFFAVSAQF